MRAEEALAHSLNIPAVRELKTYGVARFADLLRTAGMTTLNRPADDYGELHGLYEPEDEGETARITVWMRTAQKKQVVAFKTFLRTLIHELCHHLDYELFALKETFHTEGFYKRESSLAGALLEQFAAEAKPNDS